jgi:ribonucleotide monophosphatase NagD (HAD superfamily)
MATIAVDFDGTIVTHSFPEIGEPVPGALDTLRELIDNGHRIILYTMRGNLLKRKYLDEAVNYLDLNGIKLWAVNDNPEQAPRS